MALINCPECNMKISDKTFFCPNCGFPISGTDDQPVLPKYMMEIKGLVYDLRPIARIMNQKRKLDAIKELRDMTGLDLLQAKDIIESIHWPSIFAE